MVGTVLEAQDFRSVGSFTVSQDVEAQLLPPEGTQKNSEVNKPINGRCCCSQEQREKLVKNGAIAVIATTGMFISVAGAVGLLSVCSSCMPLGFVIVAVGTTASTLGGYALWKNYITLVW